MKASLRGHVEVVQTLITGQAVLDLKNHVSLQQPHSHTVHTLNYWPLGCENEHYHHDHSFYRNVKLH